jgi:putative ABC transport system permease protein
MRHLRSALARLTGAFRAHEHDDDLAEELQSHIEMATAEYVRRGMAPEAALRRARLEAGGVTSAAEAVRDQRGLPWLESVAADMKYALRALRHSPAFTFVVVVTLALGIGANTAIFSVVRGVLLKPLPHRDGDRLVYLRQSMDGAGGDNIAFSVPEVLDLRAGAKSLVGIAEYSPWTVTFRQGDDSRRVDVGLVTGNYFDVMGLSPVVGRITQPADDGGAAPPVIVLMHDFWIRRFAGDSSVIGRTITMDDRPVTVIGVLQPAPFFPARVDGLMNMSISQHHVSAQMVHGRSHRMTEVVARLAPDASIAQARAEVAAVTQRAHGQFKESYDPAAHYRVAVLPFREALGERARMTVWLLMAAAAFVMIITAANVANLTLMRGVRREHELVVRAALGAGVARLRRLLLVENLTLAFSGAVFGAAIAAGGVRLLTALVARYSTRADEIALDGTVLGFTLALSVGVALLLSFVAFLPREGTLASLISAGMRRMSGSVRRQRLQRGLVVVQVAISVVLLAGAGLLTRTMIRLSDVPTGLRTEELLTLQVPLLTPTQILTDPSADVGAKARYEAIRREMRALPGVIEVGVGSPMPLRSTDVRFEMQAEDRAPAPGEAMPRVELRTAGPEFFRSAGIPLLQGREFNAGDQFGSSPVVVINKTLADRLFPGLDPVGRRVAWAGPLLKFTPLSRDWRTVVGVVAKTQDGGQDAAPREAAYLPFAQFPAIAGGFVIRADSNVAQLTAAATRIVQRLAPGAPIEKVMTLTQYKDQSISPRRLNATLISSFGILAVIIAAVGIAGVLAFSVSARTNEIGIRMSLGADRGNVQRMILREGGLLVVLGLGLGMIGSYFAVGVIRGLLFGVEAHDPLTLVGVSATMGVIGLVACWIPALRAARIDPAITMRT